MLLFPPTAGSLLTLFAAEPEPYNPLPLLLLLFLTLPLGEYNLFCYPVVAAPDLFEPIDLAPGEYDYLALLVFLNEDVPVFMGDYLNLPTLLLPVPPLPYE